jgi:hypothetical protein
LHNPFIWEQAGTPANYFYGQTIDRYFEHLLGCEVTGQGLKFDHVVVNGRPMPAPRPTLAADQVDGAGQSASTNASNLNSP